MKTWQNVDKSEWGDGPWQNEPDKAQWDHAGFDCLIVRGPSGSLCGYVGVPPSHPLHGKGYDQCYGEDWDLDVHGGLTFADSCAETEEEDKHICHKDGICEDVWWLGFDCAHSGDLSPKYHERYSELAWPGETYKDFAYVKHQTESLARQLEQANGQV